MHLISRALLVAFSLSLSVHALGTQLSVRVLPGEYVVELPDDFQVESGWMQMSCRWRGLFYDNVLDRNAPRVDSERVQMDVLLAEAGVVSFQLLSAVSIESRNLIRRVDSCSVFIGIQAKPEDGELDEFKIEVETSRSGDVSGDLERVLKYNQFVSERRVLPSGTILYADHMTRQPCDPFDEPIDDDVSDSDIESPEDEDDLNTYEYPVDEESGDVVDE